jgi:hypothetical protein
MSKAAAKTGAGPMTMVAIEQLFPRDQRITEDDLAYQILPFSAKAFVWLMRPETGWSEQPRRAFPASGVA